RADAAGAPVAADGAENSARARRPRHGVPREGPEQAAAGCRPAAGSGVQLHDGRRLGQRRGQTLVGDQPDGADRPAHVDRPAERGGHPRRRDSLTGRTAMPETDPVLPGADAKSWLDRTLSLFTDVHAGEGATAVLMMVNVFLLLFCYSIIKIVREPLILLGGGAEVRSYTAAGQALVLMGYVPHYS